MRDQVNFLQFETFQYSVDSTTGENTRKAKISLGFDKNPYVYSDAKVSRVYSCSKSGIYINELDSIKSDQPVKRRPNRKPISSIKSDIVSIAVSPHDKTRIAVVSEEVNIVRNYESQVKRDFLLFYHTFENEKSINR